MMNLHQSFDPAFVSLLEPPRKKYPAELFSLTGIAPEQLDIDFMSRQFFRASNRKGSATADHSIDPNANVSGRGVITFNYEVPKPYMKLNSLYNLWRTLCEQFTMEAADAAIEAEVIGALYINDSWDIGRPYCFNYSMYDIALEGLKMGGRLNIVPARGLFTFLRHVEQFTVYAANSTLGATGLADLLIVSQVEVTVGQAIQATVENAAGDKCQRCWKVLPTVNGEGLCPRCAKVLTTLV